MCVGRVGLEEKEMGFGDEHTAAVYVNIAITIKITGFGV
jgi:hypothetical protein